MNGKNNPVDSRKAQSLIARERHKFHQTLLQDTLLIVEKKSGKGEERRVPTNADSNNKLSVALANGVISRLPSESSKIAACPAGQTLGNRFEEHVATFLQETFLRLPHLRPGMWKLYRVAGRKESILSDFEQYRHLSELNSLIKKYPKLKSMLGSGHIISPDVVVVRLPEPDAFINRDEMIVDSDFCSLTPLRKSVNELPLLHASISCKFTMRSDRAQNSRTEALNLIRNRKGNSPHIAVVTAEPSPNRLASLALGTGDVDCLYHIALPELLAACESLKHETGTHELLQEMVDGKRIRDISDLPLDLAI